MYIEIGYPKDAFVDKNEIEKQLGITISNLHKLHIINDHVLVKYNSILMNPAYVHITKESIEKVNDIRNEMKKNNVFVIGRYGQWKYCSIEDCMLDAIEAKDACEK